MTTATLLHAAPLVAAAALAGLALGLAYFASLRRAVAIFAAGGSWRAPAALTFGRLALAVVVLGAAAKLGPAALLAAFAGFLAARALMLRRQGR